MKKYIFSLLFLTIVGAVPTFGQDILTLNTPNKDRGNSIMKALDHRRSIREYAPDKLSLQDLSDLLWAANGVNRPDGRRTAATARNNQDIDVYVILEEGAYLYNPNAHELRQVATGDHRALIADSQDFAKEAPVSLLIVSDISRFKGVDNPEKQKMYGAMDAGIVSQNIMLFASGCGLATVPRAYMNTEELKKVLNLSESQIPMLNNPVGYPKQ